jgi:hypothetical protein
MKDARVVPIKTIENGAASTAPFGLFSCINHFFNCHQVKWELGLTCKALSLVLVRHHQQATTFGAWTG